MGSAQHDYWLLHHGRSGRRQLLPRRPRYGRRGHRPQVQRFCCCCPVRVLVVPVKGSAAVPCSSHCHMIGATSYMLLAILSALDMVGYGSYMQKLFSFSLSERMTCFISTILVMLYLVFLLIKSFGKLLIFPTHITDSINISLFYFGKDNMFFFIAKSCHKKIWKYVI